MERRIEKSSVSEDTPGPTHVSLISRDVVETIKDRNIEPLLVHYGDTHSEYG